MVDSGIVTSPADVLIEVPHLDVELLAAAIAEGNISPVLIEELSIDRGRITHIEEDLVLDGSKETLCERPGGGGGLRLGRIAGSRVGRRSVDRTYASDRNDSPGEIAEPVGMYILVFY